MPQRPEDAVLTFGPRRGKGPRVPGGPACTTLAAALAPYQVAGWTTALAPAPSGGVSGRQSCDPLMPPPTPPSTRSLPPATPRGKHGPVDASSWPSTAAPAAPAPGTCAANVGGMARELHRLQLLRRWRRRRSGQLRSGRRRTASGDSAASRTATSPCAARLIRLKGPIVRVAAGVARTVGGLESERTSHTEEMPAHFRKYYSIYRT